MITTLVLTALVVDRIVAVLMFISTYSRVAKQTDDASRAAAAECRRKVYFVFLYGAIAAVALHFVPVRILPPSSTVEPFITWFVMVAAADRIAQLMGTQQSPAPAAQSTKQSDFHVTGTLALDESSAARLRSAEAAQ